MALLSVLLLSRIPGFGLSAMRIITVLLADNDFALFEVPVTVG
jgi:hypothetical protein